QQKEIRTYRLDRIHSQVSSGNKNNMFSIPSALPDPQTQPHERALINVRKGSGFALRNIATSISSGDEWDDVEIPIINSTWLVRTILWHGDDVRVIEPSWLRHQVLNSLKEMRNLYA
ncbi:MAG: helix-turn-helix transcriptional regulator, partial [Candidatus Planktophila sp.]